jgi:solute carrier family 25 (mitochondrial folate transporter), member 32
MQVSDTVVNLASSSCAGAITRLFCHPIDTCKAKIQSVDSFRGIADVVQKTYKIEGIRGFYQGLGVAMIGGIPGVCLYISTYEWSKNKLLENKNISPFMTYFISGMVAETIW